MSNEEEDFVVGPPPTPEQVGETLDRSVDALSALVVVAKTGGDVVQAAQDISEVIQILTNTIILPIACSQADVQEDLTALLMKIADDIGELVNAYTEYTADLSNRTHLANFRASAKKVGETILSLSNIVDVSFKKQELAHLSVDERAVEEERYVVEQKAQREAYEVAMSQAAHESAPKLLEEVATHGRAEVLSPSQVIATRKIVEANVEFATVADELVQLAGSVAEDVKLPTQRAELVTVIGKTEHASLEVKHDPSNPSKQVALTMCVKTLATSVQKTEIYRANQELSEALQAVKSHADTVVEDLTHKGLVVVEEKNGEVVISAPPATPAAEPVAPKTVSIPDITNLKISVISPPLSNESVEQRIVRSASSSVATKVRAVSTSSSVVAPSASPVAPTPSSVSVSASPVAPVVAAAAATTTTPAPAPAAKVTSVASVPSSPTSPSTTAAPAEKKENAQPETPAPITEEKPVQTLDLARTPPPPAATNSVAFAQAAPTPAVIFHRVNVLTDVVQSVIKSEEPLPPAARVEKTKEMSKEMQTLSRKMTEMSVSIKDEKTRKQVVAQSKLIQDRALQLKIIMSVKAAGSDDDPAHDSQVKAAAALLEQAVHAVHGEMRSIDLQHQLQNTVGQVVAVKKAVNAFKKLQKK